MSDWAEWESIEWEDGEELDGTLKILLGRISRGRGFCLRDRGGIGGGTGIGD